MPLPEEIDIEQPDRLVSYLRAECLIDAAETPSLTNLQGGVSNRAVLVTRNTGDQWVVKQALAKLRVKADWFSSPERIHVEAAGLTWMALNAPDRAPALVREDRHRHILIMNAVPQPHDNWKSILLRGQLDMDHARQFGQLLALIHRAGWQQRAHTASLFDDRQFFQSLRLEPYYRYTATQLPEAASFLNALAETTLRRRYTVVHGDYSPKNILVHEGRLILLDYEVIHFGDPAFDLGFSLTHLLSKAHHCQAQRAAFAQAAKTYWARYRASIDDLPWAEGLEEMAVAHTLACLLARVAGRSPLEYLDQDERRRQARAGVHLMRDVPPTLTIDALVDRFLDHLDDGHTTGRTDDV